MDEERRRPVALVHHPEVRQLRVGGEAEQVVGDRVAGEAAAVAHRAAHRRHVEVLVLHRRQHVDPELELVGALDPRKRVQELPLARVLELRQEVGRAHAPEPPAAEVAVDRHADHAAGEERILRHARHLGRGRRHLAERLLHGVRVDGAPGEAELVHHRGSEDPRPAEHEAVRGDLLVAEGGGARAVDHAAEDARDRAVAVGVDVAREEGALVRGAEVDLAGHAVGVVRDVGVGPHVVVGLVRVRRGQQPEDRGRHRVDAARRDHVAREVLAGERVLDRGREDALPLLHRRHAGGARRAARDAGALVVREEEEPVLDHRAADVEAELVLRVARLGQRDEVVLGAEVLVEVGVRVELLVAQVVVGRAAERIRPRLGRDRDRPARGAPVLRGVGARHDLELLDRVDRRARDLRRQLLDVLRDRVVVDAVEQEVVLERAVAVHVHAAGAARGGAAALFREAVALHSGHQHHQVVPVADRERQPRHRGLVDHGADDRLRRVEQARGLPHRDGLAHAADLEREVDACALAHLEDHGARLRAEARGLGQHRVRAGDQVGREVDAVGRRHHARGHVRAGVGDGERGSGDDGPLLVLHGPGEHGAVHLGLGGNRDEQQSKELQQALHGNLRCRVMRWIVTAGILHPRGKPMTTKRRTTRISNMRAPAGRRMIALRWRRSC